MKLTFLKGGQRFDREHQAAAFKPGMEFLSDTTVGCRRSEDWSQSFQAQPFCLGAANPYSSIREVSQRR